MARCYAFLPVANAESTVSSPNRTLVIFPGALGDLICFLPALRALARRHRDFSLELMANEELGRLAAGRMGVARSHSVDRREVALLFSEDGKAPAQAGKFFGAFHRVYSFFGFNHPRYRRNLTDACSCPVELHPFRPAGEGHMAARYLYSIGEDPLALDTQISLLPNDRSEILRLLGRRRLVQKKYYLLLPGSGGQAKNWPASKFLGLARELTAAAPVVILLGPGEADLEDTFAGQVVLNGLELGLSAALAHYSIGFVGNDSGISHLAAAAGGAGAVIFGPTDPEVWRPLGRVSILRGTPLSALEPVEVARALSDVIEV